MRLSARFRQYKVLFRQRLSELDALPQLSVLAIIAGVLTAGVIILFRVFIEWPLGYFLPEGDPENFEGLSELARVMLPLSGAFVLGVVWYRLHISQRKVGVAAVMERLSYHQGYIGLRSLMTQFFGGVISLVSGQSGGREGPAVHLGAASSSLLGQYMKLPNNSIRTLVSCGTAAAISASFNTPIAGVIFAMEVVMMEYTITGFTPVILAAVSAAIVTQAVYGSEPAFLVPALDLNSLIEIPYIVVCGLVIGVASALFVYILKQAMRFGHISIFYRLMMAGVIAAAGAWAVPQVMGIGYDTVNHALMGQIGLGLVLAITLTKIFVTATAVGLGMPMGLVGPTFFIGATLGCGMGLLAQWLMPSLASSPGFYAMLGMGAMMGSVLQAPLSALMAMVEMTQNTNIILPGMLIIVVSSMIASQVFKQKSVFLTILQQQGLDYQSNPVSQALQRVGVAAIMERRIVRSDKVIDLEQAADLLRSAPKWILINNPDGRPVSLLPAVDLARCIQEHTPEPQAGEANEQSDDLVNSAAEVPEASLLNLLDIPAQRRDLAPLHFQATLLEALDQLNAAHTEALYVERAHSETAPTILGVLLRDDIESYYQRPSF